jgi:hypothetical protein
MPHLFSQPWQILKTKKVIPGIENFKFFLELQNCSISDLAKFLFVLGHVALKQLTHIEEIMNEIRRRRSRGQKKEKSENYK